MNRRSLLGSLTWKDNLFFLATGSLLVWSLFLAILSPTTLDFVPTVAFLRVFIVMGALRLVFLSKHTLIIAGVMAGVFALVLTVEGLFLVPSDLITGEPLRNSIFQNILELLDGTFRYALGINAHTPQYDAILSFIIITVLAVFVLVFGLFGFNFYGILSMSVGIFVVVLTSGSFEYSLAFYGFVLAVVSYMVKHLNQKSLKNIYFREAPFVLYSIPFTALAFALAFIIPTPAEESMTEGRDNFITRSFAALSDNFRAATHPRHFSLAQTGFGGGYSRRLGGNVTTNYGRALRINPQQSLNIMPMYLSGLTFDHYTGYGWRNTLADQQTVFEQGDYNDLDILKLNMLWSNILAERSMIVEHEFHSYNVFLPGQGIVTSIVPLTSQMTFLEDGAGNITTQSLMPRHSRYMVHYVMPMGGHALLDALQREDLQAPVRRVANPSEDDIWAQVVFPHLSVEDLELINNYIVPRIDWIYEHYTQLPDDFSPRVVALAQYITQDAQNNLERANMINDFLRYSGEFGYTLTPGNAPLDQDFVDWFLFDAREGYCTFFATAFVTMMRAVGVPTRYVEGFIVTGGRDADGYISVINRQGHAWAQVYFEGFGWSLFDPTPPGAVFSFSPLPFNPFPFLDRDRNLGSFQDNHDDNWDDWNVDYGAIPPADIPNDDYDAQPIANGYIEPPPSGATPYGEYPYTGTGTFRAFIISIVIAIGIGIIFLACRVLYMLSKEKKLRQKSNNEAVLGYYALILKYLKQFHFRPQASDTPLEFAKKVNRNVISFENEKVFMEDIAYIFYKAKYSDRAISDEEREMHEKALASLDLKLKKYMGPIRYYFSKFVKLELI